MAIIYKDIEGELGGQLGDAIGGQGGEFAGEMVSPLFLPFPCCNGIRCQASRLQGRHHCAVMTKDSHLIDIYTKTYIMAWQVFFSHHSSFICSIHRWEKWVDLQLKRFLFLVYHNHYNEHTMTSMTSRPGWWANWRPRRQTWGQTWRQTWWKTWGQGTWWKKVLVIMSDVRKYTYVHCPTCYWRKYVHHTSYQ